MGRRLPRRAQPSARTPAARLTTPAFRDDEHRRTARVALPANAATTTVATARTDPARFSQRLNLLGSRRAVTRARSHTSTTATTIKRWIEV